MPDLLDIIIRNGVSRRMGIRAGIPGGSDGPDDEGGMPALVQYSAATTADGSVGLTAQMPGSMIVTGIGAGAYTYSGQDQGYAYYNSTGNNPAVSAISSAGDGFWTIYDAGGIGINNTADAALFPNLTPWTGSTVTASNITAGNQVLVGVSYATSAMDSATFVGGGALTLVPDSQVTNAGIRTAWYRGTAVGGEMGVQFITDSAVRLSIQAMEFSGVSSGAAFGTNTNSGTSASPTTGELDNTGHANSLIVGVIADTESDPANMTALTGLGVTGGGAIYQTTGYIITTVADSYVGQSTTMADGNYAGSIAGFDPA